MPNTILYVYTFAPLPHVAAAPDPRCDYCARPVLDLIACTDEQGNTEYRCSACADEVQS